jgi:hypothetical protein
MVKRKISYFYRKSNPDPSVLQPKCVFQSGAGSLPEPPVLWRNGRLLGGTVKPFLTATNSFIHHINNNNNNNNNNNRGSYQLGPSLGCHILETIIINK